MNYLQITDELSSVYNKFSSFHDIERDTYFNNTEQLEGLAAKLPKTSKVLDAGCGTGYPVIKFFHDLGHEVTGSDIAGEALQYVNKHAPNAKTVLCDTCELSFPENTFDLITCFYSIMHLPMEKQIISFKLFYKMVKHNMPVYVTLGCKEFTGHEEFENYFEYLGYPLPVFHTSVEKYKLIFEEIGFKNITFEVKNTGKDLTFLWFYGTK